MKSFITVLFVFATITSLLEESVAESACQNDATYEDDVEFLPPRRTFEMPKDYQLPENITTNPMYFNEEDQMMQGRIVNGDIARERAFPYQVLLVLVCISFFSISMKQLKLFFFPVRTTGKNKLVWWFHLNGTVDRNGSSLYE